MAQGQVSFPPPAIFEERPVTEIPAEDHRVRPQAGETLYSIGDPSDEEQLYLELLNAARADPKAEAERIAATTDPLILGAYSFFNVDLKKFVADTSVYPPAQPLAFEPRLIDAARGHSQWMLTRGIQSHVESNPTKSPADRINATGYPWQRYGENIFASSKGVEYGHAGFEVDWGPGPGGMQDPAGHRENNHSPLFREVGIGVVLGTGPNDTGPQSVTVDFATRKSPVPMVTGVAYYDVNGNGRYDLGEGIGGIRVDVSGSTSYGMTTDSGGYAVPSANGTHTVTFSAPQMTTVSGTHDILGSDNIKIDLALPYQPPALSGPAHLATGTSGMYTFNPIVGATHYRWRRATVIATPPVRNGVGGLTGFTLAGTGTSEPLVLRPNGGQAYHLTQGGDATDVSLTLDATFRPRANASLQFLSRLGSATDSQLARVEISSDDGVNWTRVWSRVGSSGDGQATYNLQTVSLTTWTGRLIRCRFVLGLDSCGTCSWPIETSNGTGWHFDDVTFVNTDELNLTAPVDIGSATSFSVTPSSAGAFELSVQPVKARGSLPFGPALGVDTTVPVVPVLNLTGFTLGPSGKIRIDFTASGLSSAPILLQSADLKGPFAAVAANLKTNSPGNYSFQYQPTGDRGFLRLGTP